MYRVTEDNEIHVTRGDVVVLSVYAEKDGVVRPFVVGDVVRFSVCEKKNSEAVVLQKDFMATKQSDFVDIILTSEDTKFGEPISKPKDYWYEVELNPDTDPQTIIGYDENGAKLFRLYPEAEKE